MSGERVRKRVVNNSFCNQLVAVLQPRLGPAVEDSPRPGKAIVQDQQTMDPLMAQTSDGVRQPHPPAGKAEKTGQNGKVLVKFSG